MCEYTSSVICSFVYLFINVFYYRPDTFICLYRFSVFHFSYPLMSRDYFSPHFLVQKTFRTFFRKDLSTLFLEILTLLRLSPYFISFLLVFRYSHTSTPSSLFQNSFSGKLSLLRGLSSTEGWLTFRSSIDQKSGNSVLRPFISSD